MNPPRLTYFGKIDALNATREQRLEALRIMRIFVTVDEGGPINLPVSSADRAHARARRRQTMERMKLHGLWELRCREEFQTVPWEVNATTPLADLREAIDRIRADAVRPFGLSHVFISPHLLRELTGLPEPTSEDALV